MSEMVEYGEMLEFHARQPASRHIRVWLNGEEVTNRCFWAKVTDAQNHDAYGEVGLFEFDEDGHMKLERVDGETSPMRRYHQGTVRWEHIEK